MNNEITVNDFSSNLMQGCFSSGRGGMTVAAVVLHETNGPQDRNDVSLEAARAGEQATINWFLSGGQASIHYLIGPEITGGQIYRLCREGNTAYHAAGRPTRNVFVAPDGMRLDGSTNNVSLINWRSIGIERWGKTGEAVGANQRAAMVKIVTDIAKRYALKPEQIISHQWLQTDRSDGNELLAACREAVAALWKPEAQEEILNGFTLRGEIRQHWKSNGGVLAFGLPLSEEFVNAADGRTTQVFERTVLQFFPENTAPYRVQGLQLGRAWLNAGMPAIK